MGQQQLLIIILGVFVVGLAAAIGITMFTDNAADSNRDAVSGDLVNLAARAHQYYIRPTTLDGGGSSFAGLTANAAGLEKLTNRASNGNGTYSILTNGTATGVVIQGVGTERVDASHFVTLRIHVFNNKTDSLVVIH